MLLLCVGETQQKAATQPGGRVLLANT